MSAPRSLIGRVHFGFKSGFPDEEKKYRFDSPRNFVSRRLSRLKLIPPFKTTGMSTEIPVSTALWPLHVESTVSVLSPKLSLVSI